VPPSPGDGSDGTELPVPGVISLDHTADLGLEIRAPDLPALFDRAAAGMMHLLLERVPDDGPEERSVEARAPDGPGLLRSWLRELLFLHDRYGFQTAEVEFRTLEAEPGPGREARLEATVRGRPEEEPPVREIKGVTLHRLALEPADDGWFARVIFDV